MTASYLQNQSYLIKASKILYFSIFSFIPIITKRHPIVLLYKTTRPIHSQLFEKVIPIVLGRTIDLSKWVFKLVLILNLFTLSLICLYFFIIVRKLLENVPMLPNVVFLSALVLKSIKNECEHCVLIV